MQLTNQERIYSLLASTHSHSAKPSASAHKLSRAMTHVENNVDEETEEDDTTRDIDEIFMEIGQSGREQIKFGAVLWLLKMLSPLFVLQYSFVGRRTSFSCIRGEETLIDSCFDDTAASCTSLTFSETTIVSEWGLVCDRKWLGKATMSALMAGFLLGSLVLGGFSDRVGRKMNIQITFLGMLTANLASAFAVHFQVYLFARFVVGFFVSGNVLSVVVLTSELVGPAYREPYSLAIMAAFPVGIALLSIAASQIQNWRSLSAFISLSALPMFCSFWFLAESPRWLLSKNRVKDAECVMYRIAKGNGVSPKTEIILKSVCLGGGHLDTRGDAKKDVREDAKVDALRDLCNNRRLSMMTVMLGYLWLANGAVYYGLALTSTSIGSDIYTGAALSGLAEVPSMMVRYLAVRHYGRRQALTVFMTMSGFSCLVVQAYSSMEALGSFTTTLALLAKMWITAAFNTLYLYTQELFATTIRSSAVGLLSAVARIGSITAPFILMVAETAPGFEYSFFGLLGVTGGCLCVWLPETRGKPLPQTISEMLSARTNKLKTLQV